MVELFFPFDKDIISDIKNISFNAHWNPELGYWRVPVDDWSKNKILHFIEKNKFEKKLTQEELITPYDYSIEDKRMEELMRMCDEKEFTYQPRPYQIEALHYGWSKGNFINGTDVGCIDGDAEIQMIRCKKGGLKISLRDLYYKFNGIKGCWKKEFPTFIKSFDETKGIFIHNEVKKVIFSGIKSVVKVSLASGKSLRLTPDHEVYSSEFGWIAIEKLKPGDSIYSNGEQVCKTCGGTENLIKYKKAKFLGHCKDCVNRKLMVRGNYKGGRRLDSDGYVLISGVFDYPCKRKGNEGSTEYEHKVVMQRYIGRYLKEDECVHHINHNKSDNRIENLQLLTHSEHAKIHAQDKYKHFNSEKLVLLPVSDEIISIEDDGHTDTYDIVMADPHRSFVANKIIVHNCGKTFESIIYAEVTNSFPVLVVVPASVKYNWAEKWAEIVGEKRTVSVIETKETKKYQRDWTADVVIINYDILGDKKGSAIVPKFPELLKTPWKMFIFDEAHFLKDAKSQRSKVSKKLTEKSEAIIQLLTGTPTMSRPSELWNLLILIKKSHLIADNWDKFTLRYCGAYRTKFGVVTSGATNTLELNKKLRETCYLRVEKRDVLKDLPDVEKIIFNTPISNKKEIEKATDNLYEYLLETKGEEAADKAMEADTLVSLGVLRKLSIQGKLKALEQYLKDWKPSGKKLVIFGLHREELEYLSKKFDSMLIAGGVSSKRKQEIVKEWVLNEGVFLFANITSAGTGVDGLQKVCSNMLIIELPWRPSDLEQVIGRLDRSGQNEPSTIRFMLSNETIDSEMWEMLQEKEMNTEAVNKGIDVEKEESGMKMVLRKLLEKRK